MAAPVLPFPAASLRSPEGLAAALHAIAREGALLGETPGAPERVASLRNALEEALALLAPPPPCRLSPRERQVLHLVARGLSNPEAAGVLGISLGTVRTHMEHVLRKLDASNRVEAVAMAVRCGLVEG
jgi:DNA-binding CsgD family transcriptional regulator